MSDRVTIELPDDLARRARAAAAAGHRRLEEAVVEWIGRAVAEPDVGTMTDEELLRLCDSMLDAADQEELSRLLADSREGRLDAAGRERLDALISLYRRGTVRKARAWQEAVSRGLRHMPMAADDRPGTDHVA